MPYTNSRLNFLIETVKFIQKKDFFFSLNKFLVFLVRESEEVLTSVSSIVLLLNDLVFFTLSLESF